MIAIQSHRLTADAFTPYGDILEAVGTADKMINQDKCGRYHDLAKLDFVDGRAGISIFKSETYTLPFKLELVERHPEGSQAFIPMSNHPFLVIVADDHNNTPTNPQAFVTTEGQGINFHRGVWHGVLSPLHDPGLFAVVDRIGEGSNLEEYHFKMPYLIQ